MNLKVYRLAISLLFLLTLFLLALYLARAEKNSVSHEVESSGAIEQSISTGHPLSSNLNNQYIFEWPPIARAADSYAQWIMALMGIFATILSAIAVFLLFKTLKATNQATSHAFDTLKVAQNTLKEAKENSKAELRPYLDLQITKLEVFFDEAWGIPSFPAFHFNFDYVIKNHGPTPAKSVKIEIQDFTGRFTFMRLAPGPRLERFHGRRTREAFIGVISSGAQIERSEQSLLFIEDYDGDGQSITPIQPFLDLKFKISFQDVFNRQIIDYVSGSIVVSIPDFLSLPLLQEPPAFRVAGEYPLNGEDIL